MKKIIRIIANEGICAMGGYDTTHYTEQELNEIVEAWNEEDNNPYDYYEVVDDER